MTQKEMIKNLLRQRGDWVFSYELRGKPTDWGFLGHQGDRCARKLAEIGEIERRHVGKYAEYRLIAPKPQKDTYIPFRLPDGSIVARQIKIKI